jgi:ribosome biogenesis protein MAK21
MFLIGLVRAPDKPAAKDFSVQFSFLQTSVNPTPPHIMVKGKGKRSSGADEIVPEASVSALDAQHTPNMPDESAFAGLRQKIEQRLKNQNQNSGKGKGKDNKSKAPTEDASTKKGKQSPVKPGKAQDAAQGKKRDRNGEVIAREEKKAGKDKPERPKGFKKSNDDETLRQEILAMGGTEEDLDLLAGVDSESEVEGDVPKSKGKGGDEDLRKQLSSMLEAAGHVVPEDLEDDEVEEEKAEAEEESEEDVEAEESEDDAESSGPESDIEEAPAPKDKAEIPIPKEFAKLVCYERPIQTILSLTQRIERRSSGRLV